MQINARIPGNVEPGNGVLVRLRIGEAESRDGIAIVITAGL
jgi:hypothetical protein